MNNNNSIELVGHYGGDVTHAMSAWTSTYRDLTDEKKGRIDKLLNMLASNGHETPFEKSMLHFVVTSDIATHIHLLKHRIGVSINGESARYKELKEDRFYIPIDWKEDDILEYSEFMDLANKKYHSVYQKLLDKGYSKSRAKESARFYRPYGTQLTQDISFNFRSFVHFQRLRNSAHAQLEVKNAAKSMLKQVYDLGTFDLSIKAFKLDELGMEQVLC